MIDFLVHYVAVGDICTMAICIVNMLLLHSAYTEKNKNLSLFYHANVLIFVAAIVSICYHQLFERVNEIAHWKIYLTGDVLYITLATIFAVFCLYLRNISHMKGKRYICLTWLIRILLTVYVVLQISAPWTGLGMYRDGVRQIDHQTLSRVFTVDYIAFGAVAFWILWSNWRHFITKVRKCILQIMVLSFSMMIVQMKYAQCSFTCVTFTFPVIAALFLFHYNPYDTDTGTLDSHAFNTYIRDMNQKRFGMIYMQLKDVTDKKMDALKEYFFHFNEQYFNDNCTFRFAVDRMVMVYPREKNKDEEKQTRQLLLEFGELYDRFQIDYKLVLLKSSPELSIGEEYVGLIDMLAAKMRWNSIHEGSEKDVEKYKRLRLVELALKDIHERQDLEDERVRVFCQPVLHTPTGKFTTAEALMRIVLPEEGMIFPDEFIPIAERNENIHTLSKIIFHKTCKEIVRLQSEGYLIERISVNISMIELRDADFCESILSILANHDLAKGKVAIELTESRNEEDFELVKKIIHRLHVEGIKFYLDDFGTGYSNYARIIGLPFDIIKFDRSLTIMSSQDEQSRYLVGSFSDIFVNSDYQVLFEGIEDEQDEERCIDMNAMYLQGYRYSKPVPIEDLRKFLEK